MRVLVCGGREYGNRKALERVLTSLEPTVIIQGGATGADGIAKRWANANSVHCITYEAAWHGRGLAAGPIRNQFMLLDARPDICVVAPGGRGTKDMATRAEVAGLRMIWVQP